MAKTKDTKSTETVALKTDSISRFSVLSPHDFEHKGEKKTGWTDVGVGFVAKDGEGVNIAIKPGISVAGRLVLRPWSDKEKSESKVEGVKQFLYDSTMSVKDLI